MKIPTLIVIAILLATFTITYAINIQNNIQSNQKIITSQDLVDHEIKQNGEIVCSGSKINTRGINIPLCEK